MAQHDYVIANGTGAAVRSDLNGSLAAIVSNNSGATEPGTMYAYQWWADTTTGLLKIRNAANNAWVTVGTLASTNLGQLSLAGGTMTGALAVTAGTAALPGIAVSGDLNTGIYSPGADQVAVATNGVQRINIEADGDINIDGGGVFYDATNNRLAIGTTSPSELLELSATTDPKIQFTDVGNVTSKIGISASTALTFEHNGSERARIDANGRLLVGTSTASGSAILQVAGDLAFNSGYGSAAVAYGCRAWVNFDGVGTVAIRASGNVSSITDNGTGDYTVNFTTAMVDVSYAVAVTGTNVGLDDSATAKTTSAFRFNTYNFAATKTDSANVSVAIFR